MAFWKRSTHQSFLHQSSPAHYSSWLPFLPLLCSFDPFPVQPVGLSWRANVRDLSKLPNLNAQLLHPWPVVRWCGMMYVGHSAQGLAGSCYFITCSSEPFHTKLSMAYRTGQVLSIGLRPAIIRWPCRHPSPTLFLCPQTRVHRPSCRTTRSQLTHAGMLPSCSLPCLALPCPPTSFGSLLHILLGASKGPPEGPESRATPTGPTSFISPP